MKEVTEIIQTFLQEHFLRFALIVSLSMAAMIVAMVADLILGVKKAKENGEATTSTGLKKTCEKARKYFSPYMATVCIDMIAACANCPCPIFSMLWAVYCIFCEFVSIREKAWQKAEIRQQERTMKVILENKDDMAKALLKVLNNYGVEMMAGKEEEGDGSSESN